MGDAGNETSVLTSKYMGFFCILVVLYFFPILIALHTFTSNYTCSVSSLRLPKSVAKFVVHFTVNGIRGTAGWEQLEIRLGRLFS